MRKTPLIFVCSSCGCICQGRREQSGSQRRAKEGLQARTIAATGTGCSSASTQTLPKGRQRCWMSCFLWLVFLRQRRGFRKRLLRIPPSLFPHRPSALLLLVAPPMPAHLLRLQLNAAWDAALACSRGLFAAVVWCFSRRTQPVLCLCGIW